MTSVRTPNTGRTLSARPSTSATKTLHASNPNPYYQGPQENLNNYYRGIGTKKDPEPPIPFPYFSGMAKLEYGRKGKRLAFNQPVTAEELLSAHRQQMQAKKNKVIEEKKKAREDELVRIKNINDKLVADREQKAEVEDKKRASFIESNEEALVQRRAEKEEVKEARKAERFDYFPFTHGDMIERYQNELKDKLATELKAHYARMPKPIQVSGANK
jgi:hypothetical protein